MEDYINDNTLIQNDYYNTFKDSVICPLCLCILIDPIMCMKCQNVYCKKCVKNWEKKEDKCPNRCIEPNYQTSKGKIDILSNLQFKCKDCKMTIKYNEVEEHRQICCADLLQTYEIIDIPNDYTSLQTPSSYINTNSSQKFKKLTSEEMHNLKSKGNKIFTNGFESW